MTRKLTLTVLALALSLQACGADPQPDDTPANGKGPILNPHIPTAMIRDIWEYSDDTQCSGSALFGDSPRGCIRFAQLVRFNDGSAFYSINAMWIYGVSAYLPSGTVTFSRDHGLEMSPVYFDYRISGNLTQAHPVLLIKFDIDSDFTDTAAAALTLEAVQ